MLAHTNTAYVSIPSSPKPQKPTEKTIEAWFYPITRVLVSESDGLNVSSDRSYEFGIGGNIASLNFFLGASVLAGATAHSTNAAVFSDQWIFLAAPFKCSDGVIRLYINGVLAA